MRLAGPREAQTATLPHLLLLAFIATLGAGIISAHGGQAPTAGASGGPVVVATVAVGTKPDGVAVNPNTNLIYVPNTVTNYDSGNVSVIDGGSNTVVATIVVGTMPYGVAVDPNTNHIYVANGGTSTTSPSSTAAATRSSPP